jgi:hypothetical protein
MPCQLIVFAAGPSHLHLRTLEKSRSPGRADLLSPGAGQSWTLEKRNRHLKLDFGPVSISSPPKIPERPENVVFCGTKPPSLKRYSYATHVRPKRKEFDCANLAHGQAGGRRSAKAQSRFQSRSRAPTVLSDVRGFASIPRQETKGNIVLLNDFGFAISRNGH